ncbi:MAG: hypothetical protein CM1200mP1_14970 [Candidatus Neomarinimicrobiota bacterium]|nr:MAG: hypothetical protein CM1200mP1_14970 [Candidatus Neomarinimicrobiota bacterium]
MNILEKKQLLLGVCAALKKDDVITSTHRGHGHILAKGGHPKYMFAELLGRETGYNRVVEDQCILQTFL